MPTDLKKVVVGQQNTEKVSDTVKKQLEELMGLTGNRSVT